MKKFSKAQQADVDKAVEEVKKAEQEVIQAIESLNENMDGWRNDITEAQTKYNEKLVELQGVYTNLAEAAREYYEEKSEKWQEGETGEAYNEWVDQLEAIDLEELDIELPEDLDMPEFPECEELAPSEP